MEKLAILEVLDRDGRTRQAHAITAWPLTVGRGLDNDVVLDDPHLAEHHFSLAPEGAAAPAPLQTTERTSTVTKVIASVGHHTINGLHVGRHRHPAGSQVPLASDSEWLAGATRLRLRLAGAPVVAEQAIERLTWWRLFGPFLGLLGVVLLSVLDTYLSSSNDGQLANGILKAVWPVLIAVALWTMLWAVISKIFRHQMFFWRHLGIAAWGLVLIQLVDIALAGLSFAASFPLAYKVRGDVSWLFIAALVWFHLRLVLQTRWRVRVVGYLLAMLTVSILALLAALRYADTGRWWQPLYASSLGPSWLRMAPTQPVDRFIEQARNMEGGLQKQLEAIDEEDGSDGENDEFAEELLTE